MVSQASENVFTFREVRQLTGLTTRELKEQLDKGFLSFRVVGRERVVTQNELLEFLQAREIEPGWENLSRSGVQIFLIDLVSNLRSVKRLSPGGSFGFSLAIHFAVLTILGFLVGLVDPPEVSRFVSFNLETTMALLDVEKPDPPSKASAVTRQEESSSSPVEAQPPPRTINESADFPLPEGLSLEKQLLPIKARDIEANTFAAQQLLQKKIPLPQPVLIPEMPPAEVGIEQGAETTNETKIWEKDSLSNTPAGFRTAKQGPYRPGIGVAPPKLIYKVQPQYPQKAADAGVEGPVELEIVVKADGSVGEIEVLNLPHEGLDFDKAAIEAVQQWKFLPGRFQGKPVDVVAIVAVNFKMEK